jgi:hypothetical protein
MDCTDGDPAVDIFAAYGNSLMSRGTFSNPDDPSTAYPYIYPAFFNICSPDELSENLRTKLRFEFNPFCEAGSPGCSYGSPGTDNLLVWPVRAQ